MPANANLARLEKVSLASAWKNEARDFTPWLAREENLALLGETLNLELELEGQEQSVGPFRADILCKDTLTGNWVLIENQIARTDHTHLGQIITYAAGLKAVTIIWIAQNFTDEHRAALDWLNEITAENINFFGLEIELWKIADSPLAPNFNVVSQPNNWSQTVADVTRAIGSSQLTTAQQVQLEYWTEFYQFLHERNSPIRPQKPAAQHWMSFAIGRSDFAMSAILNTRDVLISVAVEIAGPHSMAFFRLLEQQKAQIEAEVGEPLEWREMPDKNQKLIMLKKKASDTADRSRWPEYMLWMADHLECLHRVFAKRIKTLIIMGDS